MATREDIVELLNLYAFAMDTRRWDLFDRIFTPGVEADYGPTSSWTDRERFKADFGSFHELFDATQHVMTNHLVRVEGERAFAHTYGSWRLIRYAAGDPPVWDGTGYYDDRLVRTSEGWQIEKRECRVVFWTGNPAVQTPLKDMVFQLDLVAPHEEERAGRLAFAQGL